MDVGPRIIAGADIDNAESTDCEDADNAKVDIDEAVDEAVDEANDEAVDDVVDEANDEVDNESVDEANDEVNGGRYSSCLLATLCF